jgi:hypothetical protein
VRHGSRLLTAAVTGSVLFVVLAQDVGAAWTATTPAGPGRSAAMSMAAGNQPTATVVTSASSSVNVTWPASAGGAPVAGYEVRSYEADTGVPRAVGAACAGTVSATNCIETGVPDGSWRYSVTPRQQAWAGAESPLSDPVVVDTTAPTAAITFPAASGTYTNASWNVGCASRICGTASDADSGIGSVGVSIRQGSGNYWNGSAFASATEILLTPTGTTSWSLAFPATNFPADGSYTTRAVVSDLAGNATSTSTAFTIDRAGPAPTALTLVNANGFVTPGTDEVRITFSESVNTSSICSAWSGSGDQTLGGSGVVVTLTDAGANDVATVAAGACTLRIGSVATGGNYVLLSSTFSGSTPATESRVAWTAATRVLTIHLGAQTAGLANLLAQPAGTATYTPDAAISDPAGNGVVTTPFIATGQRL